DAALVRGFSPQQTTVPPGVGPSPGFRRRYPPREVLAAAPADAVRDSWAGLGYYARARHLHAAVRRVADEHAGVFPADPDVLRRLPGVGRYTAGAVASIAFGADAAAVDTNVARVLARVFHVRRPPRS